MLINHSLDKYYEDTINSLVVFQPSNAKTRLGNNGDGGYVIIDGYNYDYYVGCGLGWNPSFDFNFINNNPNIKGLVFDGTISYNPKFTDNVTFVHKNISDTNTNITTNLQEELEPYDNIFMKMDIEGHEWKWINAFKNLNKIKQLVIEAHGFFDTDWPKIANYEYKELVKALKKLNETHYLVHFHSNNGANYHLIEGKQFPSVGELTFIRKKDSSIFGLNTQIFPINDLDFCNGSPDRPDLTLNFYPFCVSR